MLPSVILIERTKKGIWGSGKRLQTKKIAILKKITTREEIFLVDINDLKNKASKINSSWSKNPDKNLIRSIKSGWIYTRKSSFPAGRTKFEQNKYGI